MEELQILIIELLTAGYNAIILAQVGGESPFP